MPLSTRTAVALGMISLSTIGIATVFGNTILALVAPAPEVGASGPTAPAARSGAGRSAPAAPLDTPRSGPAVPAPAAPPSVSAKDASS